MLQLPHNCLACIAAKAYAEATSLSAQETSCLSNNMFQVRQKLLYSVSESAWNKGTMVPHSAYACWNSPTLFDRSMAWQVLLSKETPQSWFYQRLAHQSLSHHQGRAGITSHYHGHRLQTRLCSCTRLLQHYLGHYCTAAASTAPPALTQNSIQA